MKEPQIFVLWYEFVDWLLDRTEKFPKKARFTFVSRIDNLALDILEQIVEAAYSPRAQKIGILRGIDRKLERLRILLRLAAKRRYLNKTSLEHAMRKLETSGKMLGGWIKERHT